MSSASRTAYVDEWLRVNWQHFLYHMRSNAIHNASLMGNTENEDKAIIENNVSGKEVAKNIVNGKEVMENNVNGKDVVDNNVSGKEVVKNNVSGKEVVKNNVSGKDVVENNINGRPMDARADAVVEGVAVAPQQKFLTRKELRRSRGVAQDEEHSDDEAEFEFIVKNYTSACEDYLTRLLPPSAMELMTRAEILSTRAIIIRRHSVEENKSYVVDYFKNKMRTAGLHEQIPVVETPDYEICLLCGRKGIHYTSLCPYVLSMAIRANVSINSGVDFGALEPCRCKLNLSPATHELLTCKYLVEALRIDRILLLLRANPLTLK